MDKVLFASTSAHKLKEVSMFLNKYGIEVVSLSDFEAIDAPEEDGKTFMENAELKSLYYAEKLGIPVLSDDSGLCVHFLKSAPGVRSARYAGENASDAENVSLLLKELEGAKDRNAYFQCVLCLCKPKERKVLFFIGKCEGVILDKPSGVNGFGYDPVFKPDGFSKSFAELSLDDKNNISHRGVALKCLEKYLNSKF